MPRNQRPAPDGISGVPAIRDLTTRDVAMKERKRTILFLCQCGTNVADYIDLDDVVSWAETAGHVSVVTRHDLLCSPDGKKYFTEVTQRENPDAIVIAGCSPRMHEKAFQDLAEQAGLNMSQVHIANIREQCAWVTRDKKKATQKAKSLISAAVRRSWYAEPLEKRTMEVNTDILIIGGGIAGIEAALTAARAGRNVYLVEKEVVLGGGLVKTEDIAPSMECAPCLLAPRLAAVRDDPRITVYTNAEILEVTGFYGNFHAEAVKKARFIDENCIGCEACFDACPVIVPSEFDLGMGTRKAVYTLFPGQTAAIDRRACRHFVDNACNACKEMCPFNAVNFNQVDEKFSLQAGAIIVATGYAQAAPSPASGLGHGTCENVYCMNEFEIMARETGPCGGKITLKNGNQPRSVAVIQCAGSQHDDGLAHCFGVSFIQMLKAGEILHRLDPRLNVVVINKNVVCDSAQDMAFYRKQLKEGTRFIQCDDPDSVSLTEKDGSITVRTPDHDAFAVDMAVLVTGIKPAPGTEQLAALLHIDRDENGFLTSAHDVLHMTGASLDGIYIAGGAGGPCKAGTAVTRSHAAMGDALSKLVPGREIDLEIMTAHIDRSICGGCKMCIQMCPYSAIYFDPENNISQVNEALCRGCGTCAATCPSGAASARHFTSKQIRAELAGLLGE